MANPQADLVVGTSASSMAVFANEGLLQGYVPKGLDKSSPQPLRRLDPKIVTSYRPSSSLRSSVARARQFTTGSRKAA